MQTSDKMRSTGEGNGKPHQHSCPENPVNSMKRQKDTILKDELPSLVGAQYATGEEWRNHCRENKDTEPKWKQCPVVDVTGEGRKVQCYKVFCNIRFIQQSKLEVVKQEMARVNIDILGISELKWTAKGRFNSNDHYIYYCGQRSLIKNSPHSQQKSLKCST